MRFRRSRVARRSRPVKRLANRRRSFALLSNIVAVLEVHPEITRLVIEGHAEGSFDTHRVSETRAANVRSQETRRVIVTRQDPHGFRQETFRRFEARA